MNLSLMALFHGNLPNRFFFFVFKCNIRLASGIKASGGHGNQNIRINLLWIMNIYSICNGYLTRLLKIPFEFIWLWN